MKEGERGETSEKKPNLEQVRKGGKRRTSGGIRRDRIRPESRLFNPSPLSRIPTLPTYLGT